jgi:hypothetical protein
MDILRRFLPAFAFLATIPFSFAQDAVSIEETPPVPEEIPVPAQEQLPVVEPEALPATEPEPTPAIPPPVVEATPPPATPVETVPAVVETVAPVVEATPPPATPAETVPAVVEAVAPVAASSDGLGIALRISGGFSGFYGHRNVNTLYLRPSFSFGGGIILMIPLAKNLVYLDPAVQYSFSRTYTEWSKSNIYGERKRTASVVNHTLEVPVLMHLDLGSLFIELGPQFNFILSSTTETENASISGGKEKYDTPDLNLFVFGGAAGIGYSITRIFSVDVRGQYAFFEYAKDTYGKPWIIHLGLRLRVL